MPPKYPPKHPMFDQHNNSQTKHFTFCGNTYNLTSIDYGLEVESSSLNGSKIQEIFVNQEVQAVLTAGFIFFKINDNFYQLIKLTVLSLLPAWIQ